MTLLLVNHHYVNSREGSGAIFPASVFEMIERAKQLEHDGFYYIQDFRNYYEFDYSSENKKFFHYTFDDGLREQYEAYDELQSAGYCPTYFISTEKYIKQSIDTVHLIHYIRHIYEDKKILEALDLRDFNTEHLIIKATKQYRYDTPETALIKYILNFEMDEAEVRYKLSTMLTDGCRQYFDDLYMDFAQLKELAGAAQIGSHSHNHRALGTLAQSELKKELHNSKSFFDSKNISVNMISYPYGGPSAIPDVNVVSEYYKFGITMKRDFNTDTTNKLLLNRVDTNEVKLGLYKNYV